MWSFTRWQCHCVRAPICVRIVNIFAADIISIRKLQLINQLRDIIGMIRDCDEVDFHHISFSVGFAVLAADWQQRTEALERLWLIDPPPSYSYS